jgi:acyl-CoA thioester hydrolase
MEGFPFVYRDSVRFNDLDAFGHVNNAVYSSYLEDARNAFMREAGLVRSVEDIAMILAHVEIDFLGQVGVGEELEVGVRASRFGTKSFDFEYEVRSGDRVVASAKTVQVGFDYDSNTTIPVPDAWREGLAA